MEVITLGTNVGDAADSVKVTRGKSYRKMYPSQGKEINNRDTPKIKLHYRADIYKIKVAIAACGPKIRQMRVTAV